MTRNKGGRPPKNGGKKVKQAHLRLTDHQHSQLSTLEKESGINRTELFVKRVLDNQDFLITKDVILKLSEIGTEMGRIGNNINQLAKLANTYTKKDDLRPQALNEFSQVVSSHINIETDLYKILRQMYRVMKK